MAYPDLHSLLQSSGSTRRYFLSLPVSTQMELHEFNASIHTAAQLHQWADRLEKYHHQLTLGGY